MPSYNCGVYRLVSGRAKTVSRVDYARHDRCQTVHFGCWVAFLSLATFRTWPLAQSLSTPIPSDAGDPILNTWLFWWTRGRDPVRRAMVEAACVHSVAGHRRAVRAGGRAWASSHSTRHWLRTQRGRGLQHRIHPVVCVIGQLAVASSQFPVPSFQFPVSTSRTVSGFECPKIGLPPCRRHDWALQLATETDS